MAFFDRFSRAKDASPIAPDGPIDSVETLRRRARQRLIGSGVLVGLGVTAFALLFDRQPRQVAIDIPIEIPDKRFVKPLETPTSAPLHKTAPSAVDIGVVAAVTKPGTVAADQSLDSGEKMVPPAAATPTAVKAVPKVEPKPALKPPSAALASAPPASAPPASAPPVSASAGPAPARPSLSAAAEAARAKALLEGASPPNAQAGAQAKPNPATERFVVQFGSFAESSRAQESRKSVERAGLKTYAQEATTADGKRIRVRVGPFATRAEAERAATKIKALGLPASILTL